MKKTTFGLLVLSVLVISSCKKNTTSNSWSFKGTTYGQTTCVGAAGQLTAASANPASTLIATFVSGLPTTGGTYTVVSNPVAANQVSLEILVTSTGDDYLSNRGSVTLSVSGGKVSLSGSNINMSNTVASDTTALNVNINQTQ